MNKLIKLLFLIIVLLLIAGGVFYWKNQQEVADLNKGLPDGVRVVKTLTGDYVVVNKIDGYSFKIPDKWEGVKEIYYTSERMEENYNLSSLELEGKEGAGRIVGLNRFTNKKPDINLEEWAKNSFKTSGLESDFTKDKISELEVVKTRERIGVIGYVYFFEKNSVIYAISCGSEEFIREIIVSGKW